MSPLRASLPGLAARRREGSNPLGGAPLRGRRDQGVRPVRLAPQLALEEVAEGAEVGFLLELLAVFLGRLPLFVLGQARHAELGLAATQIEVDDLGFALGAEL